MAKRVGQATCRARRLDLVAIHVLRSGRDVAEQELADPLEDVAVMPARRGYGGQAAEELDCALEETREFGFGDQGLEPVVVERRGQDEHVAELSAEGGQLMHTGHRRGVGM